MNNQQTDKKNILGDLLELGKNKGQITSKEIFDATGDMDIEPDQMESFYNMLESSGVEIVETMDELMLDDPELDSLSSEDEEETAVSETAAVVEPKQEERVGSPIQVRTLPREQAQRSTTPIAVAGRSDNDNVNTINKRTVKISDNPALQNVPLLRRGESAATRSASSEEITDMDRVFNSYYGHLDELYSQKEHLFDNGAGDYSTVDNALFLAALVKKMQGGRNNEDVKLYREMASRLVALQQSDGLWKESLLSSTSRNADIDSNSFICYALAWGLNNGILSKSQYLEPVRKAWRSIGNCNSEAFQLAEEEMNKL